ncbi:THUMP domain-containing protein [Streptomyces mexicanus]
MWQPCVLLKYGELMLKGRNRGRFENLLIRNARRALSELPHPVRVRRRRGLLLLSAPGHPELQTELVARARQLIGVSVVQPAVRVDRTPEAAADAALRLARRARPAATAAFAVRARRRHKDFPMTSSQLEAHLGDRIHSALGWPVDLTAPEVEIAVEVDLHEIFVSVERYRGLDGLPVGSSGRALALLSGGYDSPVAAFRLMRRGLACDFVHFTGAPLTGPASAYKAYALARRLARFQGRRVCGSSRWARRSGNWPWPEPAPCRSSPSGG